MLEHMPDLSTRAPSEGQIRPKAASLWAWVWQVFKHQAASSKQASSCVKQQASSRNLKKLGRLWQEIDHVIRGMMIKHRASRLQVLGWWEGYYGQEGGASRLGAWHICNTFQAMVEQRWENDCSYGPQNIIGCALETSQSQHLAETNDPSLSGCKILYLKWCVMW